MIYAIVTLVVLWFWLRASPWGIPMMFLLEALFLGPIFVTGDDLASQSSRAEYFALLTLIAVAPFLIKTLAIYALRTRTPARAQ